MINNIPQEHSGNGGIYKIRCLANGRIYIGSTNNFKRRYNGHKSSLYRRYHGNIHLLNAYLKYGPDQLEFSIVSVINRHEKETMSDYQDRLLQAEYLQIKLLGADSKKGGFNIRVSPKDDFRIYKGGDYLTVKERKKQAKLLNIPNLWFGSNNKAAVINEQTAKEIKILYAKGVGPVQIAKHLNISRHIAEDMLYKRTSWKYIEPTQEEIDFYQLPSTLTPKSYFLNRELIVRCLLHYNFNPAFIARALNTHHTSVGAIKRKGGESAVMPTTEQLEEFRVSGQLSRYNKLLLEDEENRKLNQRTAKKGQDHASSKLTDSQVLEAISMLSKGVLPKDVARKFSIAVSCIHRIKRGQSRTHITGIEYIPSGHLKGENNKCSKLSNRDVIKIKKLLSQKIKGREIAQMLGVTESAISTIKHGKAWGHLTKIEHIKGKPRPKGEECSSAKLSESQVREIVESIKKGVRDIEISKKFNLAPSAIRSIRIGKTWGHLTGFKLQEKGAKGERVLGVKLTGVEALDIKKLIDAGLSLSEIARRFNVSRDTVTMIRFGRSWSDVTGIQPVVRDRDFYKGENNPRSKLTVQLVLKIKELLDEGVSNLRIAQIVGVVPTNISSIKTGKTWSHVTGIPRP